MGELFPGRGGVVGRRISFLTTSQNPFFQGQICFALKIDPSPFFPPPETKRRRPCGSHANASPMPSTADTPEHNPPPFAPGTPRHPRPSVHPSHPRRRH